MKQRFRWSLFLVAILLFLAAPIALAYTSASGQVNDGNGNPWTHGGTVECRSNVGNILLGSGTIQPDGSWSVTLASPSAATCVIDPAAGPNGDPASFNCSVPGGGGGGVQDYSCGAGSTNTGPNAVTLTSLSANGAGPGWLLVATAILSGVFAWWRRR
jgi:hypothetical protein